MPLASLSSRSTRFNDERLNEEVKIAILKDYSVVSCLNSMKKILNSRGDAEHPQEPQKRTMRVKKERNLTEQQFSHSKWHIFHCPAKQSVF